MERLFSLALKSVLEAGYIIYYVGTVGEWKAARILIKRATAAKHITLQTPATENPPSHTGTALNWAPQTCPFPYEFATPHAAFFILSPCLLVCVFLDGEARALLLPHFSFICIYVHRLSRLPGGKILSLF